MRRRCRAALTLATVVITLVAMLPPRLVVCIGEGHGEIELASDVCCGGERTAGGDFETCPSDCVDTAMSVPVLQAGSQPSDALAHAWLAAIAPPLRPSEWGAPAVSALPRTALAAPPPPRAQRTTIDRC